MLNGIYHIPTIVYFGKDWESNVGAEVSRLSRKVLLHFCGESFKKYGLYDKVTTLLKFMAYQHFGFWQPMDMMRDKVLMGGILHGKIRSKLCPKYLVPNQRAL
jgi:alcohol dehydrogenase YqhD (iron-dependent ADH family)